MEQNTDTESPQLPNQIIKRMDISPDKIKGKCDLKCSYSFNYSTSNCVAKNNGFNIRLTYDKTNMPPVYYNSSSYHVEEIYIFSPSIHNFLGSQTNGEIVISHYPVEGGNPLNVAIPIISSSDSNSASLLLNEIIEAVSISAPSQGETANINLQDFTLQKIVPSSPYFSYTDRKNTDWVVFGKQVAIPLTKSTLETLNKIILPIERIMCIDGPDLFINGKGPNSSVKNRGIYIDCKPTGESEEEEEVTTTTQSSSNNDFFKSDTFKYMIKILIFIIIFVVFLIGGHFLFQKISNMKIGNTAKKGVTRELMSNF